MCRAMSKLNIRVIVIPLLICCLWPRPADCSATGVHHFVFFDRERERIREKSFLETPALEGAQLKYTWRQLEPQKDQYDFEPLRQDLAFLTASGKKLFIQLQDVS